MKKRLFIKICTVALVGGTALLTMRVWAESKTARTTTTIASAVNPAVVGQTVTFTMTVTPAESGGPAPVGTVTITDGATVIETVGLNPFTRSQFSTKNLSLGPHVLTATYNGDSDHDSSHSTPFEQVISKPEATVTLTSPLNPATVCEGATVIATVKTDFDSAGLPTGSVVFKDGAATLAIISLNDGTASFSAPMSVGSHSITALYNGDFNFNPATSKVFTQVVQGCPTTLSVVPSLNPSVVGQPVSFNATVTTTSPDGPRFGAVQFQIDGKDFGSPVPLHKGSASSESTTGLAQGEHVIAATFSGDELFNTSTGKGTITVAPSSVACTAANNGPLCAGGMLQLFGTTSDNRAEVSFTWTGPNGFKSFLQNPTIAKVTPANAGTYVLTSGTAHSTNCIVQTTVSISPALDPTITGANSVCPNSIASFDGPASLDAYAWSIQGAGAIVGSSTNQTVRVAAANGCQTNFTVTLSATAGACSSTVSQTVAIGDGPVITSFPPDATFPCADFLPAADDASITASGKCSGGAVTISHAADIVGASDCTNRFTVMRIYTATDACGNSTSHMQMFTIKDNEGPAFNKVPADVTVSSGAVPAAPTLAAVDNCLGEPEVVFNETKASAADNSSYVLTRTWTATDACGNSTVAVQKITVNGSVAQVSK